MLRTSFKEIGFLVLSSGLTALAVRLFFVEYALTPGGITGMAIILYFSAPVDDQFFCVRE